MRRTLHYTLALWAFIAFHAPQIWLALFLFSPSTGSGGFADAVFNAFVMVTWGAVHSIFARDSAKRRIARLVGRDFVKLVYVSVAGITQCLLLYFWRPLSGWHWQAQGALFWALTALFLTVVGSVSITLLSLDYMEALGVRAIIRRIHNQTPVQPALSLRGPYAYCRHPAYFLTILSFWLGPLMNATKLEFSLLGTLYIIIGTYLEDRDSARNLGLEYEAYQKHVPLLFPRLTPWRPS